MLVSLTEKPCKKLKDSTFASMSSGTSNRKSVNSNNGSTFLTWKKVSKYTSLTALHCAAFFLQTEDLWQPLQLTGVSDNG